MTFYFKKNRNIGDYISVEDLQTYSKKELLDYVVTSRQKSYWNILLKECKIPNFNEKLNTVRKYRNSVAHSKLFSKEDYENLKSIINQAILSIDEAINTIYSYDFNNTLDILGKTLKKISKLAMDYNINSYLHDS